MRGIVVFKEERTSSRTPARRVSLDPRDEVLGKDVPPTIRELPEDTAQRWRDLLELCTSPVMLARLNHLLFVRGGRDSRTCALAASDAYADAASTWDRDFDAVEDLSASLRLARAVGDNERATAAMDRLLDVAESEIDGDDPKFGVALHAVDAVLDERDCPVGSTPCS